MYDVIIVGARVAGASTAMLLARRGLKVLVVDRATFPSDTLSTHQVQLPGVARLAWASGSGAVLAACSVRGTPDLPSYLRQPYGPGWALVGDAGLPMDRRRPMASPAGRTLLDRVLIDRGPGGRCRPVRYDFTARADPRSDRPVSRHRGLIRALARSPRRTPTCSSACWPARSRCASSCHRAPWCASSACGGFARLAFGQARPQRPGPHVPAQPGRLEKTAGRAPAD